MLTPATLATIMAALACALLAVHFAVPPTSRKRRVRVKVLARALLPRRIFRSRSGRLDIMAFLFSALLLSTTMGWALLSSDLIAEGLQGFMSGRFGHRPEWNGPGWLASAVLTLAVYVAYEFAYWLNHWLSHRLPILWEFHKVHHTAESLSPMTNYRVHPIDTIVFYNMVAVCVGSVAGLISYGFGGSADMWAVGGSNLAIFISAWLLTQLQHTHLWMTFPDRLGKLLVSPAHHQIHHSTDPRHHNRNFGSTLAIFDWMFGTLQRPTRERERLRFGVAGLAYDPHSLGGAVVMPFVEAANSLKRRQAEATAA
jgi:sterol desaturase/sphingolipid hydroxylase (fatty acid hydroxylase superfamily)